VCYTTKQGNSLLTPEIIYDNTMLRRLIQVSLILFAGWKKNNLIKAQLLSASFCLCWK